MLDLDCYWLLQKIKISMFDEDRDIYKYQISHINKAIWDNKPNHETFNFIAPIKKEEESEWEKNY